MHFSTNDGQHSKVFAKIPFQSDFLNCSMRGENDLSFQRISKYGRILVWPNLTKKSCVTILGMTHALPKVPKKSLFAQNYMHFRVGQY